jgi:hypothetical protein
MGESLGDEQEAGAWPGGAGQCALRLDGQGAGRVEKHAAGLLRA